MKRIPQILALLVVTGLMISNLQPNFAEPKESRVLRHVVLFKFKEEATEKQIQEVVDHFRRLPEEIDVIHDFEWGTDVSPEGLSKGLTHCFFVTFQSEADRDAYLPHPAHQEFVKHLRPILEDVTVVDYWTQK